ncbi:Peptidyl-prolyl cis-trans isomerase CYP59 [Linum grandiflorum]
MSVLIVTTLGDLVVDLFTEKCPVTCKNFLKLCKIKYYNGCLFHTVQKDFTAQTGDPTGIGSGGDSVYKLLMMCGLKMIGFPWMSNYVQKNLQRFSGKRMHVLVLLSLRV